MTNHTNVDQAEINKFNQMVASWWDENGSFSLILRLNPIRINYILSECEKQEHILHIAGKRVLDLGCGAGILTEGLAQEGAIVTGIDLSSSAIEAAKSHMQISNFKHLDYQYISAEDMALQHPQEFDVICCMEMLEHVPDYASILVSIEKMLKPGGIALLSTINRTFRAQLEVIEAAENYLEWVPQGTHEYPKFIKPLELITTARKAGFEVLDVSGYKYDWCNGKFYLDKDPSSNYLISLKKPNK